MASKASRNRLFCHHRGAPHDGNHWRDLAEDEPVMTADLARCYRPEH